MAGESPLAGDKRGYKYPLGVFGKKKERKKGRFAEDLTRLRAEGPANSDAGSRILAKSHHQK